jgi:hypothetical protein
MARERNLLVHGKNANLRIVCGIVRRQPERATEAAPANPSDGGRGGEQLNQSWAGT